MNGPPERRKAARWTAELAVSLRCVSAGDAGGAWIFARTRNVGRGGMCLRVCSIADTLAAGTPVELYCAPDSAHVPGKEPVPVRIRARIAWRLPDQGLVGLCYA